VEAVAGDQRLSRLAMNASRSARVASVSSRPRGLEEGGELTDADQVAGHGAVGRFLARRCRSKERLRLADALLSITGP
jgi:hypothetical protein